MILAPILLFVYNRPAHLQQAIKSLLLNDEAINSLLFIYSDAAKDEDDLSNVEEVRQYIHTIKGFASVTIIEREKNWGLAQNIIDGVTTQVSRFGR
ncbi:MAG: glycosyltransferase, partial [Bacteroidaceae bacterium]|nr:glycosyltransferase [Bacteroidaceae bacterium]